MSRTLDSNITSAISSGNISPFFAFKLDFENTLTGTESLFLYTGQGNLIIDDVLYTGVGSILNFTNIEESADIGAKQVSITLSGIPSTNLSLALQTPYQGREVTISFGIRADGTFLANEDGDFILNQDGHLIDISTISNEDATSTLFVGYIDTLDIQEGPETSTITVNLESKLLQLERQKVLRYTSAIQKSLFAGDKGFDFVDKLQDKKFVWGRSETK